MIPSSVTRYLERTAMLHARYRAGQVHARPPEGLKEPNRHIDDLIALHLPVSHAALERSRNALFYSLPVAFDPAEAIGPYLATADRDPAGEPFRFLDMGALIATQALGENDPVIVEAVLTELPVAVNRYAHSEYQTSVSLRMKAALDDIAPVGTPRHFVVNTGAEAVENAIKAVLLSRVRRTGEKDGGFITSFEGAYHGRTLGSLAVTHRKRARLGFPTFDWPQASWPTLDKDDALTRTREERSLRRIWTLFTVGRHVPRNRRGPDEAFTALLGRIDAFLERGGSAGLEHFVAEERAHLTEEQQRRALRCAAVLAEPIQGEGGIRLASGRFFRRLRLLTRIHDVPLIFDEIQTGFGATGRMWAHEHFELPSPPDVVTWAKKAQNGVLFVSEELSTFFQEEKKFNTTWEGDAVGMVRLLATIGRVKLPEVERTGGLVRAGLERLAGEFPELVGNVRGLGVMLGFDVARADWRDVLRDRAFRRGLLMMPAGERALRVYARYDTEPYAIAEAMDILRAAVGDVLGGDTVAALGPRIRVGAPCTAPVATLEALDLTGLTGDRLAVLRPAIMAVEIERYGAVTQYPADVMKAGARPLLQYPAEALDATLHNPRAIGVALHDPSAGKVIAYAVGSPLEYYDEEGVALDPTHGEHSTFYLQAMATLPSVKNQHEVERHLLDLMRARAVAQGFDRLSTLIEDETRASGPPWLAGGRVIKVVDNYLRSGVRFVYVLATIAPGVGGEGVAA